MPAGGDHVRGTWLSCSLSATNPRGRESTCLSTTSRSSMYQPSPPMASSESNSSLRSRLGTPRYAFNGNAAFTQSPDCPENPASPVQYVWGSGYSPSGTTRLQVFPESTDAYTSPESKNGSVS